MDLGLTLTADDLAAAAAKDMTEKNGYGLERDVADLREPLITSGSGRKHRMLPGGRWCVRPAQRQLWGDEQVLPHVNWGDLFFDLFYVSAFYNLSYMYKYEVSTANLVYFFGCFGPIMTNWMDKTHYTARFEAPNDAVHRVLEILELCALGLAVLNIKSASKMSYVGIETEMFLFSISLVICNVFVIIRYFEIGFIWVEGGSEAKIFARLTALIKLIPLGFFVTAAVLTVMLEAKKTSIIPMYFCIGGWFAQELTYFFMFGFASADESNKGWVVPMNIPYLIHRYGEWTNLVLGESVLALLTSATSKDDYYIGYQFSFLAAFFMSLATVILLQYLHFASQPHHTEDHALNSVHGFRAASFLLLTQLYSAALVLVGTCFKMLMYSFTKLKDAAPHMALFEETAMDDYSFSEDYSFSQKAGNDTHYDNSTYHGGDGAASHGAASGHSSTDELGYYEAKDYISKLYCISLACSLVLLYFINVTHKKHKQSASSGRRSGFGRLFLTVGHIGVVLVVLFAWAIGGTNAGLLVLIGLLAVFSEVLLKVFERTVLYPNDHTGAPTSVVSPIAWSQLKQFEKNTMGKDFQASASDVATTLNVISAFNTA